MEPDLPNATFNLDLAKRLDTATATIRLVPDEPRLELQERFSMLTMAAGLRSCALLVHLGPAELQRLRSVAIECGIFPLVSRLMLLKPRSHEAYEAKIARVLRQHDERSDHQILWVCATEAVRNEIKKVPGDSWRYLGYPQCCVERELRSNSFVAAAFEKAIVEKAGGDPLLVRRALREDWKVKIEVPEELQAIMGKNISRTHNLYPFAVHTACTACLDDPASPTARINQVHEHFAREYDPALHERLLREVEN